ncbi:MAG: DegT/DnrJ/EryC1/StrS family aminotransferase [Rudaea sp.]
MSVRQFDLTEQHARLKDDLEQAWRRVFSSNRFVLGCEVEKFEQELAAYLGGGRVVGVNSGSDALLLSLCAAGVGAGDKVVLPAYTFCASLEAVLRVGAIPVFVDCAADGFNCDPGAVVDALACSPKAVIVVHLFGLPMQLAEIAAACRERGIVLIEDAAQALGTATSAGMVGAHADFSCFSFYPTKNLGALGDGGAIRVSDERAEVRLRRLRNHGLDRSGTITACGFNSRMDELQAAFLRAKLPHLDRWVASRQQIAAVYRGALAGLGVLPRQNDDPMHGFNQFAIRFDRRDALRDWLHGRAIETRVYYATSADAHPALTTITQCAQARRNARQALALPMYPELDLRVAQSVGALVAEFLRAPRGVKAAGGHDAVAV